MIRELGAWVLQTACAQCKRWHHLGYGITVAVNVSIIQLMTPGFTEQVAAILAETELEPEFLELELTESKLMGNAVDSAEVLRQLKALGVKIAIDDFGTGYSSLSYLKDFSVDRLKIDRSFVHELSARSDAAAIVMAIIAIGHNLGLKVIAEGIESVQEEEILAQYLCDDGQGFFYARPMGVGELTRYLVANAGDAVVEAAADAPSPSDASAEAPPWSGKPPASPARGSTPPSPPRPDRPRSGAACRRPEPRGGRSPHRSSRRP
jgi:EAL domain-containing protein (putative c-di-GMP-specific phosphodiesterase class I)